MLQENNDALLTEDAGNLLLEGEEEMAVPAANYGQGSDLGSKVVAAARALRDARNAILTAHAALDYARDAGAVGDYLALKLGCPTGAEGIAEATKIYDEMSSLKGYVESTGANTLGAAVLQACAKLGV